MSSPKKEAMKLSELGLITGEALLAYLKKELSPEEKQEVETLLHGDPFAQDALEGLRTSQSKERVGGSIVSLHKKIRERVGLKDKKGFSIHWTNYAWAAVVLGLLMGIGFLMISYLGKKDEHIAQNDKSKEQTITSAPQKAEEAAPPKIAADTAAINSAMAASDTVSLSVSTGSTTSTLSDADKKPKEQTVSISGASGAYNYSLKPTGVSGATGNTGQVKTKLSEQTTTNIPASNSGNANSKVAQPSGNAGVSVNTTGAPANNSSALDISYNNKNAPASPAAEKKESDEDKANVSDAMKNFYAGDYKKAAGQFDKILKREPDNADALYFGGISDYIDGRTDKSEKNFDKILKKGSLFVEGAKWYKANILVKKGDIEHGKNLLQELSNSNGSYKERATKKLAEMTH